MRKPKGWRQEPIRHGLSARGIKSGRKSHSHPKIKTIKTSSQLTKNYLEDAKKQMKNLPSRNEDEFYKDMSEKIESEVVRPLEEGKITDEQADAKLKDIATEFSDNLEYDLEEPTATIYEGTDEENVAIIGAYTDIDQTPSLLAEDVIVDWHSTDAWRGYYNVKIKGWKNMHSDCILSMSEDAEDLKKFDDEMQNEFEAKGIHFARAFARTSNVFSGGYDLFVKDEDVHKANEIVSRLKKKYRDEEKFRFTALTGTSPSKATEHDKMFVEGVGHLEKGATPEEAVAKVLKKKK
jgi:hypothetical protein